VVAAKASAFVTACRAAGIDVLITSTYRDNESQNALYAQGRTNLGKRVTNAKGGQSMHNHRVAFDFVPIVNGKAMWDDARAFRRCGVIAQSLGLEWGGSWTSFPDLPHCQYTGGLTLAQLQAGKVPK
jgi:peptidoglycan L-alanyl-D-glutamate endopeptidase CwlK